MPRCYDCGRKTVVAGGAVGVRLADGVAGFAGVATCGRIWLCPVCNSKIMARRALDLGLAVTWAAANELFLIWGSVTCSHDADSDLDELLEIQRVAWRHVVSSKAWRKASTTRTIAHVHAASCEPGCERKRDTIDTGADGRVGYVRAAEITIGANGWHPHFHPLIFWRGDPVAGARFAQAVRELWVEGVQLAGGVAQLEGAQQLKLLDVDAYTRELAGYMTKATYDNAAMALEVAWSQGKVGKGKAGRRRALGTVAHWSILAEVAKGLADSVERWSQLEAATAGHRMLMWSRGLRTFVGLGVELDDEEVAAEEVGSSDDTVCFITPDGWAHIRDTPRAVAGILSTLEAGGWSALRSYLDEWRVEYFTLDTAPAQN